jgi:hypothetical protein
MLEADACRKSGEGGRKSIEPPPAENTEATPADEGAGGSTSPNSNCALISPPEKIVVHDNPLQSHHILQFLKVFEYDNCSFSPRLFLFGHNFCKTYEHDGIQFWHSKVFFHAYLL